MNQYMIEYGIAVKRRGRKDSSHREDGQKGVELTMMDKFAKSRLKGLSRIKMIFPRSKRLL
jgi:hypothetical protein